MLMEVSEKEMEESRERISFLYQSKYLQDNLTAVLMDTSRGEFGLEESIARAKISGILSWLKMNEMRKNSK